MGKDREIEITDEMINAGVDALLSCRACEEGETGTVRAVWQAMFQQLSRPDLSDCLKDKSYVQSPT